MSRETAVRTPGPWRFDAIQRSTLNMHTGERSKLVPDGYAITAIEPQMFGGTRIVPNGLSEADAAFIVKAANNHDALVKALEAALLIAKQEWDFPGAHPHRAAVVRDMEDALAHVSGAGDDK